MQEKDRYKNGRRPIRKGNDMGKSQTENRIARAKVHTKVERYGKGSGSRPHGFPTDAIAGVSPIHNGAEVPYEKGIEMGKRCEAKQDRYKNDRKIDTKVARKGMRP